MIKGVKTIRYIVYFILFHCCLISRYVEYNTVIFVLIISCCNTAFFSSNTYNIAMLNAALKHAKACECLNVMTVYAYLVCNINDKLKWYKTRLNFWYWHDILFQLLLLSFHYTEGQICPQSLPTVREVDHCPTSAKEWNLSANKKKCQLLASIQNCSVPEKFVYHCLVNEEHDGLIEVCAPMWILSGKMKYIVLIKEIRPFDLIFH